LVRSGEPTGERVNTGGGGEGEKVYTQQGLPSPRVGAWGQRVPSL
jgi:hypothetical protein